jgi:hypothetical protein
MFQMNTEKVYFIDEKSVGNIRLISKNEMRKFG